MGKRIIFSVFCFFILSFSVYSVEDSVSIDTITNYQGWGWDVLVVNNNYITMGIVPVIGARVLQYDLGVDTFMIVNEDLFGDIFDLSEGIYGPWSNKYGYGGYKTWPAPQSEWPGTWPPPPIMDWGEYEYEVTHVSKDSVTIWLKGQTEQYQAPDLRFDRYITAYRNSTQVKVVTVLFNDSSSEKSQAVWEITQTIVQHENEHDYSNFSAYFPAASASDIWGSGGPHYEEVLPGIYRANYSSVEGKIFVSSSDGWVSFVDERDQQTYAKVFDMPEGAEYADDGASVELYTSGSNRYMEVEVLGPYEPIGPNGDSIVFVEYWYATQNSGPIYNTNHAGTVTQKLAYSHQTKTITGEYGVFTEGELRVKYFDSEGAELGDGPVVSVYPDTLVQISESVTLPGSTSSIALYAYDVDDLFIESIDQVNIENNDSFIAYKATETPVIDGIADESFWGDTITWYPLDYVWLPYEEYVAPEDFTGRFKISWTDDRLLLLVEIVDDVLYDIYSDPLSNYWNDDCVEVFLDEDHSGGSHGNNYNAFAYHVSTTFDVVDGGTGVSALFNSHIEAAWTQSDSLYTWELSIKVFDDTYVDESSIPVTLANGKEMGYSLAYCDNDASVERENFIGSKYLEYDVRNDSYLNASIFGTLTLIDPNAGSVEPPEAVVQMEQENITLYPNPASETLYYWFNDTPETIYTYSIIDLTGQVVCSGNLEKNSKVGTIEIKALPQGSYIINFRNRMGIISKRINLL